MKIRDARGASRIISMVAETKRNRWVRWRRTCQLVAPHSFVCGTCASFPWLSCSRNQVITALTYHLFQDLVFGMKLKAARELQVYNGHSSSLSNMAIFV